MPRTKRVRLRIGVTVPAEVPARDLLDYVRDAVDCWGGQRHPDDPLFYSNKNTSAQVVETTLSVDIQDMAAEPWFGDVVVDISRAVKALRDRGVPRGVQINVLGGTLHVR